MLKKISIITLIMVVGATLLFADFSSGRDIIEEGTSIKVDGTLKYDTSEWYLETEDGSYQLHFGNKDWLESTGIVLEDGKECSIEGISNEDDIVVSKATIDEKTYSFRERDGIPLWAHKGNARRNMVNSRRINSERDNHGFDSRMHGRSWK